MKKNIPSRLKQTVITFVFAITAASHASIVGPYNVDANTLHLYHLDQAATPVIDSVSGGVNLAGLLNGATLNNASFSGFGTALNTLDGGQNLFATTNRDAALNALAGSGLVSLKYFNPTTTAFTFEALVQINFDPTKNLGSAANGGNGRNTPCQIICCENNANANRVFQFRIDPIGVSSPVNLTQPNLVFVNVNLGGTSQNFTIPIPTSGPDAIVSNNWYHVAVTYNGNPGTTTNINFFWTLVDPSRTKASLIGSGSMNSSLPSASVSFELGNTTRSVNANFLGSIDEVRISSVDRGAAGMMFTDPGAVITTQPVGQVVAVNQAAAFSVVGGGQSPLFYQWRLNSNVIAGATQSSYSIASCQFTNAGSYDVIVSNSFNAVTSVEAVLTVRTPLNLTWLGAQTGDWDTANAVNWLDTANATNAVYSPGDNVTFDANGSGAPSVNLVGALSPSAIVVNANTDYTFSSLVGGSITGYTGLSKSGSGNLILDTDITFSGAVAIQGGTVQLGQNDAHGSLGSGSVLNNGGIIINRTSGVGIGGAISGSGGVTNLGTGGVNLSGNNSFSGSLVANAGGFTLVGTHAAGNTTNIVLNASANTTGATSLSLSQSVLLGSNVTLSALGTSASPDFRDTINSNDGTNVINAAFLLAGDGLVQLVANGTSELDVNTPIVAPGFTGKLVLRGAARIVVNGPITTSSGVNTTDTGLWLMNATGNFWTNTTIGGSTMRMGAVGVLPTNITLTVNSGGTLDLAGFSQQVAALGDGGTTTGRIGSSSVTSDCVFTLNTAGVSSFDGLIVDSLSSGTRRVGLTLIGGSLILGNTNTFSGPTIITGGSLVLSGNGGISNSSGINITSGGTVDASSRSDGTFTLNAAQTLSGDGAFNILGNLTSLGNIQLKLNKTGVVLANDSLNGASVITYGGTLNLVITGNPLGVNDAFKLFSAAGYGGAFTSITPATPGAGLAWDTSTLDSDGTLRIISVAQPSFSSIQISGTNLVFNGINGNPGAQFEILASTNVAMALSSWVSVLTNNFDSGGSFTATIGIDPAAPKRFFTIRTP